MKLSFDYLKDEILKFKAQSFLQQGSIIILRSIFKDAEEKFNSSAKRPCNTGSPKCPACGIYRCESCGRPVTPEMKGICECGSLRADA